MKILDRHIGFHVVRDSLLALFTLLAVFSLVEFLDDLSNVGKGSYTVVAAIEYMLLTTPNRIFILFPIAGVIGTLIGLGSLAAHRELVVIRAAGVSSLRIAGAAMKAAAVLTGVWDANRDHPGGAHYLIHSYDDPVHALAGTTADGCSTSGEGRF